MRRLIAMMCVAVGALSGSMTAGLTVAYGDQGGEGTGTANACLRHDDNKGNSYAYGLSCTTTVSASIILAQTFNGDGTFTLTLTATGLQPGSTIEAHNITYGQTVTVGNADVSGNFSAVSTLGCTSSVGQVYYTGTSADGQPYTSPIYTVQQCPV